MAEVKRIFRSRRSRVIAGVCGGLAEYFQVDPVLIRLATIALGVMTGPAAVVGYILAWIVIPEETQYSTRRPTGQESRGKPADVSPEQGGGAEDGGAGVSEDEGKLVEHASPAEKSDDSTGEPVESHQDTETHSEADRGRVLLGYFLVALGGLLLLQRVFHWFGWWFPRLGMAQFWPIVLIFVGAVILVTGRQRK